MNDRDELADILMSDTLFDSSLYGRDYALGEADAILAAGYRKPRTITTVEELDALALDSVILDADDMTLQLDYILNDPSIKFWSQPGSEDRHGNGYVTLPATVLWEPLP